MSCLHLNVEFSFERWFEERQLCKCPLLIRFMICCDRCEEWFHGECVGITEARGRLMERNGEDYICPNCTAKKNQVVRPATSNLSTSTEVGKLKADGSTAASTPAAYAGKTGVIDQSQPANAVAAPPPAASAGSEEKTVEDQGIKGRIEKATNPTGKKKIKIFQPVGFNTSQCKGSDSTVCLQQQLLNQVVPQSCLK